MSPHRLSLRDARQQSSAPTSRRHPALLTRLVAVAALAGALAACGTGAAPTGPRQLQVKVRGDGTTTTTTDSTQRSGYQNPVV